MSGNL